LNIIECSSRTWFNCSPKTWLRRRKQEITNGD